MTGLEGDRQICLPERFRIASPRVSIGRGASLLAHVGKVGRIFDVLYLIFNIKYPSDHISDGYSIFIFHTQLSNHSQMDIRYSLIKRPSEDLTDGYSIFECQTSI